jgi:hypothetical protein
MPKQLSNGTGVSVGQSTTDTVGFHGATPIAKATVTALTDGSTGTANAATGIAALTGTYNSTLLINAIATLADGINRLRTALVNKGLIA